MKDFGNIDSKYRFVIIASKRAKELLKGAKARLKTKSKNPIRIAQSEVKLGLVEYEILQAKPEDVTEQEERVFIGEEVGGEFEEEHEESAAKGAPEEEVEHEGEEEEAEEFEVDFSDEFEPLDKIEEEEKGEEEES